MKTLSASIVSSLRVNLFQGCCQGVLWGALFSNELSQTNWNSVCEKITWNYLNWKLALVVFHCLVALFFFYIILWIRKLNGRFFFLLCVRNSGWKCTEMLKLFSHPYTFLTNFVEGFSVVVQIGLWDYYLDTDNLKISQPCQNHQQQVFQKHNAIKV